MQAGQSAGDIGWFQQAVPDIQLGTTGTLSTQSCSCLAFSLATHASGWANMVKMDFELAKNKCLPIPPGEIPQSDRGSVLGTGHPSAESSSPADGEPLGTLLEAFLPFQAQGYK